ncbi:hypothetical protein PALI_a6009 [Pseudoalteromonas aliena SW19]|uniref:Uncharacterized protein n=1 Tax=Pseudoalteromonas aliena SW19 TaxID=1314866 RepID=A0ABR9DWV9_9GAMM|nr:hypothetical protein [Pseudoalteromonas aliena SW19]
MLRSKDFLYDYTTHSLVNLEQEADPNQYQLKCLQISGF